MNLTDYLDQVAWAVLGAVPTKSPLFAEKDMLVNDLKNVERQSLVEYATWYDGDSSALMNLYKVDNMVEFPTEPFYWANRRRFFWSLAASSKEEVKCVHCDFAKDMVDTAVLVMGDAYVSVGGSKEGQKQWMADGMTEAGDALRGVLEANDFNSLCRRKQIPYTMAEGWGGFKITWNTSLYGKDPVVHYYRAENTRVHRRAGRLFGMTFLDWYRIGAYRYLVAETRMRRQDGTYSSRFNVFKAVGDSDELMICEPSEAGIEGNGWDNMPCMFAEPCSFYDDPLHGREGKSVYEGKLDMLDDLDMAFSIASDVVKGSAPLYTYDLDYCERDPKTKQPKRPAMFTKRFVMVSGQRNALGEKDMSKPVEVIQPDLNLSMFDEHVDSLKRNIISGHLSPATFGLDVDKKDHSKDDTVRDVSVTLFTRTHLCGEEGRIIKSVCQQLLTAKEYLMTGKVCRMPCDWDVRVEFDDFSDKSYEAKVAALSSVLVNDGISPEMYVRKVYGNTLSDEERQKEIDWITENHKNRAQDAGMGGGMADMDSGADGMDAVPESGPESGSDSEEAVLGGGGSPEVNV